MTQNNKSSVEMKESFFERNEALRKESIGRYLDLYYKGHITKEALASAIKE